MIRTRTIADTLTAVRPVLGLYLIWLGWFEGAPALPLAALVLVLAWATDVLDGPLARRDTKSAVSWIGRRDLEADLLVASGVWIYLWGAGFLQPAIAISYLVLCALLLWVTRSVHVGWGVQAVPYAIMIWSAWIGAQPIGWLLIGWILFVLIATWPRFPQSTLPDFLHGMARLFRK